MTTRTRNTITAALITLFATVLLAVFLMPFLYMVFTSLKSTAQLAQLGSPIWPARNPTYTYTGPNTGTYTVQVKKGTTNLSDQVINLQDYVGQSLPLLTVPLPGGKKDLALLKGFQKGSVFIDPANVAAGPIVWNGGYYGALPRPWLFAPAWQNYVEMWKDIDYPRLLGNTIFYAATTTVGVLLSCVLVAFGFSRFRFPGRDFLFMVLISILFLPTTVTIVPTYTFFTKIGWVGTWLPLIVPAFFANPYDTFLLRQYFMTLPRELDESAMLDGAGPLRVLWDIILPQSWPAVVAVTIFHVVWAWNDYFGPLIYLARNMSAQPVSVALARFNGIYGQRPELIQAGALLTLIIPVIIFAVAQRFFVQGIVITGVEK
jgi:multiple sugar transport system permease protein